MDPRKTLSLLAPLLLLQACGSGLSSRAYTLDGGRPDRGYTACGDATCVPGEYCVSATFADCAPGCLGDDHCPQGLECHRAAAASSGTCGAPGASDGDPCGQVGRCEGGVYYCYFGPQDSAGTCRLPCGSSFDCSRGGFYSYDCCPVQGLSAAACVPSAVAPKDGSCQ